VRVVFLNPPLRLSRNFIDYPYFVNAGLLLTAAAMREKGFDVAVVDAFATAESDIRELDSEKIFLGTPAEAVVRATAQQDPDVVVICHSPFVHPASAGAGLLDELCRGLRRRLRKAPLVLADCHVGGMHYREYDADEVLNRTGATHIVKYEPELGLASLLESLAHDGKAPSVIHGEPLSDLETLPVPAFDLIDLDAYDRFLLRCFSGRPRLPLFDLHGRALPILFSRGCPFRCIFCTSNPGRKHRQAKRRRAVSAARARALLDHLAHAFGVRTVVLLDELANADPAVFTEILTAVQELDLRIEIPNGVRADRLTRTHLELLRGRTTRLSISAESGSQRVVDRVIHKNQDLAEVHRVVAEAASLGLPLLVHFMLGVPGERLDETLATLRMANDLFEEHGAVPALQFATPLEGSPLWEKGARAPLQDSEGHVGPQVNSQEDVRRGYAETAVDVQPRGARRDNATVLQFLPHFVPEGVTPQTLQTAKELLEAKVAAGRQAKLILNLSYRCNNSCLFCAVGDRGAAGGTFEAHKAVLLEHLRRGVRLLDLDGGEPTLVPHLLPLIRYARRMGYERVCVTTNGRRLAYEAFASALLGSGITDLLISLHGHSADIHERLTRSPSSYEQTLAGLRNAVRLAPQHNVTVGVNTTLTTMNYRHLLEFVELLRSFSVHRLNIQFVTPFGRARPEIVPDPAEVAPFVAHVIEKYGAHMHIQVINLPFCYLPGHERHLMPDLYKRERRMVFVSTEEVNLADYLSATRERRDACARCLYQVACGGFYNFSATPRPILRPEREGQTGGTTRTSADRPVRLVDVILGYRCNSKCAFCSLDDALRTTNLAAEDVIAKIRASLSFGPTAIRFGGGEPTLWPELPDLVRLARELGFQEIAIQTNGFLLSEDGLAARLVQAGLNKLSLSLRGPDARTHDALTRTPGSFERVVRGLAAMRSSSPGLHIEGDVIVTRQTLPRLVDIVREFGPRGIRKFNFWYVAIEGRVRGHEEELVPRLSEVTDPLIAALDCADTLGLQAAQCYYVPYCFLPGHEGRVWDPAGENCLVVTPNETFRLELGEIDLGVKTDRCRGCAFEARCFGVRPGYIERFGDAEIHPVRQAG